HWTMLRNSSESFKIGKTGRLVVWKRWPITESLLPYRNSLRLRSVMRSLSMGITLGVLLRKRRRRGVSLSLLSLQFFERCLASLDSFRFQVLSFWGNKLGDLGSNNVEMSFAKYLYLWVCQIFRPHFPKNCNKGSRIRLCASCHKAVV